MRKLAALLGAFFLISLPSALADNIPEQSVLAGTDLITSTTSELQGFRIRKYKGVVKGTIVRQPTVGQGLSANLERLAGGKISAYANMNETAVQQAFDLCLQNARSTGANAIVGLRFDSVAWEHGDNIATRVTCYGTAVEVDAESKP